MNLEDIIYIVITIVIFVISLLGKSKKQEEKPIPTQSLEEPDYKLNEFDKLLKRKTKYVNSSEEETDEDTESKKEERKKDIRIVDSKIIEQKTQEEDDVQDEVQDDVQDGFDMKSAVIYSEILTRKQRRR